MDLSPFARAAIENFSRQLALPYRQGSLINEMEGMSPAFVAEMEANKEALYRLNTAMHILEDSYFSKPFGELTLDDLKYSRRFEMMKRNFFYLEDPYYDEEFSRRFRLWQDSHPDPTDEEYSEAAALIGKNVYVECEAFYPQLLKQLVPTYRKALEQAGGLVEKALALGVRHALLELRDLYKLGDVVIEAESITVAGALALGNAALCARVLPLLEGLHTALLEREKRGEKTEYEESPKKSEYAESFNEDLDAIGLHITVTPLTPRQQVERHAETILALHGQYHYVNQHILPHLEALLGYSPPERLR